MFSKSGSRYELIQCLWYIFITSHSPLKGSNCMTESLFAQCSFEGRVLDFKRVLTSNFKKWRVVTYLLFFWGPYVSSQNVYFYFRCLISISVLYSILRIFWCNYCLNFLNYLNFNHFKLFSVIINTIPIVLKTIASEIYIL